MTGWTNPFNICQKKKMARGEAEKELSRWQNAQTPLAFSLRWSRVCLRYSSYLMLSVVTTWLSPFWAPSRELNGTDNISLVTEVGM